MTRAQLSAIAVGLAIVTALTVVRIKDPPALQTLRQITFDQYQHISPRPFEDMPVRVVDIDEASLKEIGQWPWPRDRLASLVNRLAEMGAAAIAFDILFAEPDRMSPRSIVRTVPGIDHSFLERFPDNDELFAKSIVDKPVVLGFALSNTGSYRPEVKAGFAFTGEDPITAPPLLEAATPMLPQLAANAAGIGHINLDPSAAVTVVRSVPLFVSDGTQLYPNLTLEALRVALGASTYVLAAAPDRKGIITSVKVGNLVIPLTGSGELWLYVNRDRRERYVSAKDILAAGGPSQDVQAAIEGNIVFIGTSASGLQDIRTTALGENVPGVSLHAQAIEQILAGRFLSRPDWADGLEIFAVAVLGTIVVLMTILVGPIYALTVGVATTILVIAASWLDFRYAGFLFDPLAPVATGIISHISMTTFRFLVTDRQRRQIRRAFGQYLSPSLLHRIETNPGTLRLGGDDRELTVIFVDVRNFTTISESLPPTALISFLNILLDALSRHITANEGTLDKFIGDSIMAFWNAPLDVTDHERKAVRTALAMRETMVRLNADDAFGFGSEGKVNIGIGIHTGLACVGNMGAESRFNYSAVGDAVNTAARIESTCKEAGFDILISERTAQKLDQFALLDVGSYGLKGKTVGTKLFAVIGDENVAATPAFAELKDQHAQLMQVLGSPKSKSLKLAKAAMQKTLRSWPQLHDLYRGIFQRPVHLLTDRQPKNAGADDQSIIA